jgi:hypothetical protein
VTELQIHSLAEAELAAAARFYEARLHGLGEAFLVELGRCFDRVRSFPESGTRCYGRFRRFPYDVVYEVLPHAVLVVAVAHQQRKPGYWRTR